MRARRSQLDMAKALTPYLAERHFHAALVANHAAMLHALVFAAQALPVRYRTEDFGAEQTVTLRLERAVIDGLRLRYFAVRPGTNFFRTRQTDANGIKVRDQAGSIIGAAAIQGYFLLPSFRRGRVSIEPSCYRNG